MVLKVWVTLEGGMSSVGSDLFARLRFVEPFVSLEAKAPSDPVLWGLCLLALCVGQLHTSGFIF